MARLRISTKALTEILHESTPAWFSCVRGCMSNMALGIVKRSIWWYACSEAGVELENLVRDTSAMGQYLQILLMPLIFAFY